MDVNEFTARTENLKSRLYRTALLYVGSENIALDTVDETIFHGFKSFKKLRQPEYFETWRTRILINECKKELRRRKREQQLDTLPETATDEFDSLPLKEAIRRLPQGTVVTRQRRAINLLRLELSEEE